MRVTAAAAAAVWTVLCGVAQLQLLLVGGTAGCYAAAARGEKFVQCDSV